MHHVTAKFSVHSMQQTGRGYQHFGCVVSIFSAAWWEKVWRTSALLSSHTSWIVPHCCFKLDLKLLWKSCEHTKAAMPLFLSSPSVLVFHFLYYLVTENELSPPHYSASLIPHLFHSPTYYYIFSWSSFALFVTLSYFILWAFKQIINLAKFFDSL